MTFLLADLRRVLTELIVIANGVVQDEGRKRLSRFADAFVVRENRGFDAGAWKEGIVAVCGEEKLRTFDEVVLANDSFFGPFIPFQTIFERMEERKLDFWGLSVHGEAPGVRAQPMGTFRDRIPGQAPWPVPPAGPAGPGSLPAVSGLFRPGKAARARTFRPLPPMEPALPAPALLGQRPARVLRSAADRN